MEWTAMHPATRRTSHDHRYRSAVTVMHLGSLIDNLIETGSDKIGKLHFRHRNHSIECRSIFDDR